MAIVTTDNQYYTAIANAIRGKNGTETTYKPADMAAAITALLVDSSEKLETILHLSGDCSYKFYQGAWDNILNLFGDSITTAAVTRTYQMFYLSKASQIPFKINMTNNILNFEQMCYRMRNLTEVPQISVLLTTTPNIGDINFRYMFSSCSKLRDANGLFEDETQLEPLKNVKISIVNDVPDYSYIFSDANSLRTVPSWWYKLRISEESSVHPNSSYCLYYRAFSGCYVLDEIINIPVIKTYGYANSNMFVSMVQQDGRLKNFTFELNNGVPYEVNWKSQTIDLSQGVGYLSTGSSIITTGNTGLTFEEQINSAETYNQFKNNPNSWTQRSEYSRYNHDSAVATINSLPDTSAYLASAGGTNTIKFDGDAGSATDGGAINTLTPEEIAVATAKGWTVTFA